MPGPCDRAVFEGPIEAVNINLYSGTYTKFVPLIVELHGQGRTNSEIEKACAESVGEPYPVYNPSRYMSRISYPTSGTILYILKRIGLVVDHPINPRSRIGKILSRQKITRPIDMGGPRDVWIEGTPQSMFYELATK
jgi:hypothetical protein